MFAVPEKEDKRVMVKYKALNQCENDFEVVDKAWEHQRFFIHKGFKFPDDQFTVNLDAVRNFARGIGHFISERKLNKIVNPDPKDLPVSVQPKKRSQTQLERIVWFRWGSYDTFKFDARAQKFGKIDTDQNFDAIPPFKHLYFSSCTHLPDGLGAYLTGGCDEFNNFYRRALFFAKYEKY